MTKSDIAALRALEQAATQGEWEYSDVAGGILTSHGGKYVVEGGEGYGIIVREPDIEVIVAARNALPGLLDEVERLRDENTRLTAVLNLARAEEDDGR